MPLMPSPARRLAAAVVLLMSLAIVVLVGAWGIGVPIGIGQVGTTPLPATPSAAPSASVDPLTVFAQIEGQVQTLRGLPAATIGPPQVVTRAQLAQILPGLVDPPLDNATLRAMGLLGADQDIVALTNRLYDAQVLGFYDFDAKRMVVVSDSGLTPEARITYAHEYTHALQDAAFDSGAAVKQVTGQHDRELALLGLEEGDASVAMVLWAIGHLSSVEMSGITETPLPDMSGIPAWMVTLLEYPYLAGSTFVSQLYAPGGWDAVNAVYADLPASSEQVLHPAKYLSHEAPMTVAPIDLPGALGGGWTTATDSTMGEAWISTWLEGIGVHGRMPQRPPRPAGAATGSPSRRGHRVRGRSPGGSRGTPRSRPPSSRPPTPGSSRPSPSRRAWSTPRMVGRWCSRLPAPKSWREIAALAAS